MHVLGWASVAVRRGDKQTQGFDDVDLPTKVSGFAE
jgi:hypothetical protein